jgi:hypothetical protein
LTLWGMISINFLKIFSVRNKCVKSMFVNELTGFRISVAELLR